MITNVNLALSPTIDKSTRERIFESLTIEDLEHVVRQPCAEYIDLILDHKLCDSVLIERFLDFNQIDDIIAKKISDNVCCSFAVLMELVDHKGLSEDFFIDNVLNHVNINHNVLDRFIENGRFKKEFIEKYIIEHKLADDYIKYGSNMV